MNGAGFAVTKDARTITKIGGRLGRIEKALANRRNRRHIRRDLHTHGEDATLLPKLFTSWDVL